MADDLQTVALRPMVVGGQVQTDDYEVVWRGLPVGRILKQPDSPHWWWSCNLYGQPAVANDRGPAINFKDCQVRFNLAWTRIRPALTEQAIAVARQHAEQQLPATGPERDPNAPQAVPSMEQSAQRCVSACSRPVPSSLAAAQSTAPFGTSRRREPHSKSPALSASPPSSIC